MDSSPYFYSRDSVSRAAHHWDYRYDRSTHALCGHEFTGAIVWEGSDRPKLVCRKCQEVLPQWEGHIWRQWADQRVQQQQDRLDEAEARAQKAQEALYARIERLEMRILDLKGHASDLPIVKTRPKRGRSSDKGSSPSKTPSQGRAVPQAQVASRLDDDEENGGLGRPDISIRSPRKRSKRAKSKSKSDSSKSGKATMPRITVVYGGLPGGGRRR